MALNSDDADLLSTKQKIINTSNTAGVAPEIVTAAVDGVESAQADLIAATNAAVIQANQLQLDAATQARMAAEADALAIRNQEIQNQTAIAEEAARQQSIINAQTASEQLLIATEAIDAQRVSIAASNQAQADYLAAPI